LLGVWYAFLVYYCAVQAYTCLEDLSYMRMYVASEIGLLPSTVTMRLFLPQAKTVSMGMSSFRCAAMRDTLQVCVQLCCCDQPGRRAFVVGLL
jgi:hypothetical protein